RARARRRAHWTRAAPAPRCGTPAPLSPAERTPYAATERKQQPEGGGRSEGEHRAPPRVAAAAQRTPANARLRAESGVIARGRHAVGQEAADHEHLGQARQPGERRQTHPEIVVLRHWD